MTPSTSRRRLPRIAGLGGLAATGLVAGAVIAQSGAAAAPSAPVAAQSGTVSVTLREFTLRPSPATAAAGTVTFRVRNAGRIKHEFVVLRTTKRAANLLKGAEASEAGNVGEIGNVPKGTTRTLRVRLRRGHYALICNLPGHYRAGQRADFNVS
jgi:uncharacterized cupredoxin-like copper-binding protein